MGLKRNLKSGMDILMSLTASEICLIIESCHKNGVESCEISQGTLKVVFTSKPIAVENSTVTQPSVPTTETASLPEKEEDPAALIEEQDNAELLLNDPLKFESMVASGELLDEQQNQDN